jgi:CubicO group peptidase (beta-lactamase class C family)
LVLKHVLAAVLLAVIPIAASAQTLPAVPEKIAASIADIDRLFETYQKDTPVPGLVYGIVADGRLVHVRGLGVQDTATKRPVTADSLFRIASMSKAFTALAILDLRDQGKLSLDAPAETYVPEMRGWTYPTTDAPRIRVRDLLNHVAGFVTDDPWGDRQQPLPEAEFTKMLAAGVPFSRPPQSAMEYSNFAYATLGRIVTNVSGKPYQHYIAERIMRPLGMASTGYDIFKSPKDARAIGYRWEGGAWKREPDMADGTFGAMGGVETTATDYARYVAWLLSAWPARDGAETAPLKRSTVREIVQGSNFAVLSSERRGIPGPCAQSVSYGMGWRVINDCELSYVTHTGGYPGYGSVVMLVPGTGIGVFAFSSRTYSAPVAPAYLALKRLKEAGAMALPAVPVSDDLRAGYAAAATIWNAGDVMAARDRLAVNMLLDRDAAAWKAELARLKAELGTCRTTAPITATTAMAGRFAWDCDKGRLTGSVLLAPTGTPMLQNLTFTPAPPAP